MRETMSVTSSTQNKIIKRSKKNSSSRSRINRFEFPSNNDVDGISLEKKNDQIQKAIPLLARAFANGFFTEVNCRLLPENCLDQLAHQVYQYVQKQGQLTRSLIFHSFIHETLLNEFVKTIYIGDLEESDMKMNQREMNSMNIILYQTKTDHPSIHGVSNDEEKQNFASRWTLPHCQFESLWETLQFDLPIKSQLMQYVFTLIRFNKANIDKTIIHCNQTILFYGPPGCGKTTLCKGLAQKVSIRMKELFSKFYFYELNAGSLFSKWFSESSHNLSRFFDEITQICCDSLTFVIILIDEIESLSMSRRSSLLSNEPSDMLRVVNTLLTQIDRLKSFSNILILTTSNLIEIIDHAMIDRSDLHLFIGPPSISTIFHIYRSCFDELIDKKLLFLPNSSDQIDEKLWNLAQLSEGISGRTLRKLPMIAFSHIQQFEEFISSEQLFKAMHQQLIVQKNTKHYLEELNQ